MSDATLCFSFTALLLHLLTVVGFLLLNWDSPAPSCIAAAFFSPITVIVATAIFLPQHHCCCYPLATPVVPAAFPCRPSLSFLGRWSTSLLPLRSSFPYSLRQFSNRHQCQPQSLTKACCHYKVSRLPSSSPPLHRRQPSLSLNRCFPNRCPHLHPFFPYLLRYFPNHVIYATLVSCSPPIAITAAATARRTPRLHRATAAAFCSPVVVVSATPFFLPYHYHCLATTTSHYRSPPTHSHRWSDPSSCFPSHLPPQPHFHLCCLKAKHMPPTTRSRTANVCLPSRVNTSPSEIGNGIPISSAIILHLYRCYHDRYLPLQDHSQQSSDPLPLPFFVPRPTPPSWSRLFAISPCSPRSRHHCC
ncbi:hypothetical protein B296_00046140 [Ensete ventricosum]|uniref:Uncharacterized protein n=1 Tax=Ensete ventricosum TaxID=4639 RepID=A0A426Z4Z3_ENSVE|nr:hypothetical protein B296_00046140 [Ensete ventricosum]